MMIMRNRQHAFIGDVVEYMNECDEYSLGKIVKFIMV